MSFLKKTLNEHCQFWLLPIILQNFRKILRTDFENKVLKLLGLSWGKNKNLDQTGIFQEIFSCNFCLLMTMSYHSKKIRKLLKIDCQNNAYETLGPNVGKIVQFWTKVLLVSHHWVKFRKIVKAGFRTKGTSLWVQIRMTMFNFGATRSFFTRY